MFRASRTLFSSLQSLKATTGIAGLQVHPDPLPALKELYTSTLSTLSTLPSSAVYRQATEALTKHRMGIVDSANGDISKVETELGSMVETLIEEAKAEQRLASKMIEWKSWESLEQEAPKDQWRYFDPTGDSL